MFCILKFIFKLIILQSWHIECYRLATAGSIWQWPATCDWWGLLHKDDAYNFVENVAGLYIQQTSLEVHPMFDRSSWFSTQ